MLQLKYNNEFLDLEPGQSLEFNRNNPLFLLDDLLGEYSTPIVVSYSEKNVRLLGYNFFDYTVKQKLKVDVELYDGMTYFSLATLVIDHTESNKRFAGKSNVSGFLLTGISRFFSKIKNKYCDSLLLGGDRTFAFTTTDPDDLSSGYIQHFKATWTGNEDYMIAPVRNDIWTGNADDQQATGYMNKVILGQLDLTRPVVLFPKLKYVIEQMFIENGFTIDITDLAGTDWDKLFLFAVKPLPFQAITYTEIDNGDGTYSYTESYTYYDNITFRLSDWLDSTIKVNTFIVQIFKKYGWALINVTDNSFKVVALKNIDLANAKDFTRYISESVTSDYSEDGKIFAFKNDFNSNDEFPSSADLANYSVVSIDNRYALPAPSGTYDNTLVFVHDENKYYKIDLDADSRQRIWVVYADNIYDYEPVNATNSIDSEVTTLPVYYTEIREESGVKYYGTYPLCEQSRYKPFGIRTLLYAGMQYEQNPSGANGTYQYPQLTSLHNAANGTNTLAFSNVYVHKKGTTDYGIKAYWFDKWLLLNAISQSDEANLYLPFKDLIQLQWDDVVNIFNMPFLIKSMVQPVPYKNVIKVTLQRLLLATSDASQVGPGIYLRILWES